MVLPLVGVVLGATLSKSDAREGRLYERRADTYVDLIAEAAHWRENSHGEELPPRDDATFKRLIASVEAFASNRVREAWQDFRTEVSRAMGMQHSVNVYDRDGLNEQATAEVVRLMESRSTALDLSEVLFHKLEMQVRGELAAGGGHSIAFRLLGGRRVGAIER